MSANNFLVTNEPILIDKRRAAYLLDVSPRQIDRLITRGELRAKKIGRRTLVLYSSLKRFCAEVSPGGATCRRG